MTQTSQQHTSVQGICNDTNITTTHFCTMYAMTETSQQYTSVQCMQ